MTKTSELNVKPGALEFYTKSTLLDSQWNRPGISA